jgi:hypothetical protein
LRFNRHITFGIKVILIFHHDEQRCGFKNNTRSKKKFHLWKKVLELNKESNNQIGGKKTNGDHTTHSPKNT